MAVQPPNSGSGSRKAERGKRGASEPPDAFEEGGKRRPKGTSGLWAAVVVLALALAELSGYGYLAIRQNGMALSQLPGLPGVEQLVRLALCMARWMPRKPSSET